MKRKCTNRHCPYVTWGGASFAYDQDVERWKANRPNHDGLCLNCIDDDRQDRELAEDCAE